MTDPTSFASTTARFNLPLLHAGQSQKEVTVNESLLLLDSLAHTAVEGETATPPETPENGQAWLVAADGTDAFSGHDQALAVWGEGGWRFLPPREGMRVFDRERQCFRLFAEEWRGIEAPVLPTGGSTIDVEARAFLADLVQSLRNCGLLP
ncbi:DUF2793 domain-containing protein [Novosphingobium sp. EMRT-2]|uniref:DUF2793 domain-containing protein n=1 Tax=Novosphingobium sp. EMRT-2 TaxID=2571749 RepID=UPI0010BDC160|nr:DUF2793 domain-containing protein [Novosphingobium sp. EMRT-2]QCI93546.1 DUF2793 domain-containing protein [Novosphingobium sp. EMRT-2]